MRAFTLWVCLLLPLPLLGAQDFKRRAYQESQKVSSKDIALEIEFGKKLAAKIIGSNKLLAPGPLTQYVATLGAGLAAYFGRPELQYYFAVLDQKDINAYACPGGYIFVTQGAIQAMQNEAQLLGVLAHELAHVNQKHVVKALKLKSADQSITSGFAAIIGGSSSSAKVILDQLSDKAYRLLFEEGLNHRDEYEADALALQMTLSLDYDAASYIRYLKRLEPKMKQGYAKVVSQTHPALSSRVTKLRQNLAELNPERGRKTNSARFQAQVRAR